MIKRMFILFVTAALCGAAVNFLRPSGKIKWVQDWGHYVEAKALEAGIGIATLEETRRIVESGQYVIFDARPKIEFDEGHIPGAVSFPYEEVDTEFLNVSIFLTPEQPILTYCSGETCEDSFQLSAFLKEQNYTNVYLFAGGINAWESAGHDVEGRP